jgi:hypothetical protein
MAKGKNSKSAGKTSAGIHSNVARSLTNAIRADYMSSSERVMNQLRAYKKGKRVMLTMANPNKSETHKAFIRVPAYTVWKDPKQAIYSV